MPKILFIQPTQYDVNRSLCKQRKIHFPGLVFPLLAAMTPDNWDVEVCIEVVEDIDFDTNADIVGIGTMGYATFRGMEIAQEFRRRKKLVVAGGYMASIMSNTAADFAEYADSVVIGDAEKAYPQLLRDYENSGTVQPTYNMPIEELEGLPVPRYELLMEKPIGDMLPVQAGRGCNRNCSFCSISALYRGKYLSRPVDEVIRDIEAVRNLGFRKFLLLDDNIVSNPEYLRSLCREIEPLNMTWGSQCSLDLAKDPSLLQAVHRAGARMISFGLESITQEGLDKLGKSWLDVSEHRELIKAVSKAGIVISSEMMVGTDSDTVDSIEETYNFVQETRIPIPRFYIMTPIPGTDLFDQYKALGRLVTENFEEYDGSRCIHKPAKISADQLTEMYWWLYGKVFTWKSILHRTLLNPAAIKMPSLYLFSFFVNLHYRKYVRRRVPPNIF